jgi:hypothetical protein
MGQVNDYTETVHLEDQVSSSRRNSMPVGLGDFNATRDFEQGCVGIDIVTVVSQSCVANTEGVEETKVGD